MLFPRFRLNLWNVGKRYVKLAKSKQNDMFTSLHLHLAISYLGNQIIRLKLWEDTGNSLFYSDIASWIILKLVYHKRIQNPVKYLSCSIQPNFFLCLNIIRVLQQLLQNAGNMETKSNIWRKWIYLITFGQFFNWENWAIQKIFFCFLTSYFSRNRWISAI